MASYITIVKDDVVQRIDALQKFRAEIPSVDIGQDSEFQKVFRESQMLLELSDQQIADALLVSRPTVNRWVRGKNLPHQGMRKPIIRWINQQLSQKLKLLQGNTHL